MGLLSNLFGRSDPPKANLDNLFAVPSAALTLEAGAGFTPTGVAAVCYRGAEGGAFATAQTDVQQLLDADGGPKVERTTDEFGFTWLICRADATGLADLVNDVHAVNSSLENAGFGTSLLCSLIAFQSPDGKRFGLVYLYKQGTFYPFAPTGKDRRDNALELEVRGLLTDDLPFEPELGRWMALWGAPAYDRLPDFANFPMIEPLLTDRVCDVTPWNAPPTGLVGPYDGTQHRRPRS